MKHAYIPHVGMRALTRAYTHANTHARRYKHTVCALIMHTHRPLHVRKLACTDTRSNIWMTLMVVHVYTAITHTRAHTHAHTNKHTHTHWLAYSRAHTHVIFLKISDQSHTHKLRIFIYKSQYLMKEQDQSKH